MRDRFRSITSRSTTTAGVSSSEICMAAKLRNDLERGFLLCKLSRHHVLRFDRKLITTRRETRETYEFRKLQMRHRLVLNVSQHVIKRLCRGLTVFHQSHRNSDLRRAGFGIVCSVVDREKHYQVIAHTKPPVRRRANQSFAMHKHIRKLCWIRRKLARGLDVTTEHHWRRRKFRVRFGQNNLLASRSCFAGYLISDNHVERVVARSELQILPVENVVGENLFVVILRKVHVKISAEPRQHSLRRLLQHSENLQLHRLLVSLALKLHRRRRKLNRKRNCVQPFARSKRAQRNRHRQRRIVFNRREVRQEFLFSRRQQNDLFRRDRVITGARSDLHIRPAHFDFHFSKTAVEVLIRTAICERVARVNFLVDSFETLANVVVAFEK